MTREEVIIRKVLEGECSARCMDDDEDREATIIALVAALNGCPITHINDYGDCIYGCDEEKKDT